MLKQLSNFTYNPYISYKIYKLNKKKMNKS